MFYNINQFITENEQPKEVATFIKKLEKIQKKTRWVLVPYRIPYISPTSFFKSRFPMRKEAHD